MINWLVSGLFAMVSTILTSVSVSGAESPPACPAPGHVIRWEASYCMFISETDDLESESVQQCLSHFSLPGYDPGTSECDRKIVLRRKMCELYIANQSFQGSIESCEKSKESVPPFVSKDD